MLALRLVEHPSNDAVVHIEDLIGDRRLGVKQDGDQRGMTSLVFQVSLVLRAHLRALAREAGQGGPDGPLGQGWREALLREFDAADRDGRAHSWPLAPQAAVEA